jgi:predicted metal-dependent phosphoesterase TrpH
MILHLQTWNDFTASYSTFNRIIRAMRVEFHCHSIYSGDCLTKPADLVQVARVKGLGRLIVTDHNETRGAFEAQQIAPELVIVGEEIMTTRGEILAAFVRETVPPGLTPHETLARLRAQGAFISVSHPFDTTRSGGWTLPDLRAIAPLVDAIEIFNARCFLPRFNQQAEAFAREHNLPGTAGSDAHSTYELGGATLDLPPFETADELRAVISRGKVVGSRAPAWVRIFSRYAKLRKKFLP